MLYNARGQVAGYTYPDGKQVTRSYHADGGLHEVHHDGNLVDRRIYDSAGRMTRSTYGNGVVTDHAYNADNSLTSITHSGTGSAIGDYSYTWDANKNKLSETITGVMSGYGFDNTGYDSEDRLTAWNRDDNNLDQSWDLSPVGDWNSITENGTAQSRSHGPTHELLTADSQSVTHDVKGNMTLIPSSLRPDALSLSWDQDNKMSSANTNGVTVTQRFDALGRRVARNNDIYVQVGQQTVADYISGTAPTTPAYTYVYASYIDEPVMRAGTGSLTYFHRNQQYSVVALTDSNGNVKERYAYDAYGTPTIASGAGATLTTSAENNRYLYTGREWDETLSLYHYRARMYDSISGRFCSRDPIGYVDVLSLLTFLESNPLNQVDPSGHNPILLACGVGMAWGAAGPIIHGIANGDGFGQTCCAAAAGAAGGCVFTGALAAIAAMPQVTLIGASAMGCLAGVVSSAVTTGLQEYWGCGDSLGICDLYNAAGACFLGAVGGAHAHDTDVEDIIDLTLNLIGLNVGVWGPQCRDGAGGGPPVNLVPQACCSFSHNGQIWSERIDIPAGSNAGSVCSERAAGNFYSWTVIGAIDYTPGFACGN